MVKTNSYKGIIRGLQILNSHMNKLFWWWLTICLIFPPEAVICICIELQETVRLIIHFETSSPSVITLHW